MTKREGVLLIIDKVFRVFFIAFFTWLAIVLLINLIKPTNVSLKQETEDVNSARFYIRECVNEGGIATITTIWENNKPKTWMIVCEQKVSSNNEVSD